MVSAYPSGDSDVLLLVQTQRPDGSMGLEPLNFHQTSDGWQWVVSKGNLDHLSGGMRSFLAHAAQPR